MNSLTESSKVTTSDDPAVEKFWAGLVKLTDEYNIALNGGLSPKVRGSINRLVNSVETITYHKHHYVRKTGLKTALKLYLSTPTQALKWSEVLRWLEKWGIEVENKAFDELKEIIGGNDGRD